MRKPQPIGFPTGHFSAYAYQEASSLLPAQLISDHPDIFWGLIASLWIGNVLLVILNVPLIQVWVKVLQVPYRYLFPSVLFFIAIGVYSTNNSFFHVSEVLVFGLIGAVFVVLDFPVAPILLGFVLGPMVEENFRRTLLLSQGDLAVFVQHPISAAFLALSLLLVLLQAYFRVRPRSVVPQRVFASEPE